MSSDSIGWGKVNYLKTMSGTWYAIVVSKLRYSTWT